MHTDKHGFRKALFIHPPGEPLVFCKGLVSVSIRVHPWLTCFFQDNGFKIILRLDSRCQKSCRAMDGHYFVGIWLVTGGPSPGLRPALAAANGSLARPADTLSHPMGRGPGEGRWMSGGHEGHDRAPGAVLRGAADGLDAGGIHRARHGVGQDDVPGLGKMPRSIIGRCRWHIAYDTPWHMAPPADRCPTGRAPCCPA